MTFVLVRYCSERVEVISAEYCFPVKQYFYFIASISEPSPSKIAMSTCHKLNGTLPSELDQNLSSNIIDVSLVMKKLS